MCRISLIFLLMVLSHIMYGQHARITNLQCAGHIQPAGVDSGSVAFSWETVSLARGFLQTAWQVQVSDNEDLLKQGRQTIWDSHKITGAQSAQIRYAGSALLPAHHYYWRVRVWDQLHNSSAWSPVAGFTTGLFSRKDWDNAQWIGFEELPDSLRLPVGLHAPDAKKLGNKLKERNIVPLFRKTFTIPGKPVRALLFISGLGQYVVSINGKAATNNFLAPGWTNYDKTILYNTYDVTGYLQKGLNALGVIVGNGFYHISRERYFKLVNAFGLPVMICRLRLVYKDGSTSDINSDASWKTAPSPITFSSIYGGEDYDARLEQKGWDKPGFNDGQWKSALLVKRPGGELKPEMIYPVAVKNIFRVKSITSPKEGVYIYDFGQNASAIIALKVQGKKGQTIKLTPAELLNDQNLANQNATGSPYYYSYTLKSDSIETWMPRFTYYGFRYVQVEGAVPAISKNGSDLPRILNLEELHTSSSAPQAGSFNCSNTLFNRIDTLIKWAIQSNLQSVVTDCPHREKLGWLEQDYLMGNSIHDNFDIYQLYRKLVFDMMDAQTPDGLVPDIAPEYVAFNGGFRDSPEWGSASVILPWLIYKWYGDKDVMTRAYPMMKKYVAYLGSKAKDHILSYGLGDWFDYGPRRPGVAQLTPVALTATAIYYYDVHLLAGMADLLDNKQEADELLNLSRLIKTAFNKKFFNPVTKVYDLGSQTAMAMPLCVGLVEEQDRQAVFKNMVDSINATGKKLTAGDIGYHFLVQALHDGDASQLLYDMNFRDDVPGYGYQLKKGATSLTESWPALKEVSNNHLMLGHIMEWFYAGLAGIGQTDSSVAYKELIIKPEIVGNITRAAASYHGIYGTIISEWKKEGNLFYLHVQVPANSSAFIYLPANSEDNIYENNLKIRANKDIRILRKEQGRIVVRTGSGNFHFLVHDTSNQ